MEPHSRRKGLPLGLPEERVREQWQPRESYIYVNFNLKEEKKVERTEDLRGCRTARSCSSTTRRCLRRRTKLCPARSSLSSPPSFQHFPSILRKKRSSQPS